MRRITVISSLITILGLSILFHYSGRLAKDTVREVEVMQCRADCRLHVKLNKPLPQQCKGKCK